jgi:hypothetical protein
MGDKLDTMLRRGITELRAENERLRADNAALLAACELGGVDPLGIDDVDGPTLLRRVAELIETVMGAGILRARIVATLRAKAAAEDAAIQRARGGA